MLNGRLSIVRWLPRKWSGASTWVPIWALISRKEVLELPPWAMALVSRRINGGSPGQTGRSGEIGKLISYVCILTSVGCGVWLGLTQQV
jgi:hypothetical protein